MSTQMLDRPQQYSRQKPVPEWAVNNAALRELLTRFFERRAGFRYAQPGTPKERLDRAQAALLAQVPRRIDTIKKLCRELVAVRKQDPNSRRVATLTVEIEALDTQLRLVQSGPAIVLGIVYHYYRNGYTSAEIGQVLKLKPPNVRQILRRLDILYANRGRSEEQLAARRDHRVRLEAERDRNRRDRAARPVNERDRTRFRKMYQGRKAAGLCVQCGKAKPRPNRVRCGPCAVYINAAVAKSVSNAKAGKRTQ